MKHPNATVGAVSGVGGGQIVVNIAKALGYTISTGWGITIAGGLTAVALFIGRNGIKGVWRKLMNGSVSSVFLGS